MNVLITGYLDGKKIHAIKGVRSVSGLGLEEAKEVIDRVDMGNEPEVELRHPDFVTELDEMGVQYRVVQVDVSLDDLVAVLSDYPRHLTVGDLHDTLKIAATTARARAMTREGARL